MPSFPAPNGSKPTKIGLVGSDPYPISHHPTMGFSHQKNPGPVRSRFESSFSGPLQKKKRKNGGKSPSRPRNSQQNVRPKTEEKLVKSAGVKSMHIILCTVMPLETLICRLSHEVSLKWIMMDFRKPTQKLYPHKNIHQNIDALGFWCFFEMWLYQNRWPQTKPFADGILPNSELQIFRTSPGPRPRCFAQQQWFP